MTNSFDFSLSMDQIIFAAVLGLVITFIIQSISKFNKLLKEISADFTYSADDISKIMDKCYAMFPIDKLLFKGETYLRGAKIRVTTLQNKIFEGELIGVNNKNMICILTNKSIIAHEINNIDKISALDK